MRFKSVGFFWRVEGRRGAFSPLRGWRGITELTSNLLIENPGRIRTAKRTGVSDGRETVAIRAIMYEEVSVRDSQGGRNGRASACPGLQASPRDALLGPRPTGSALVSTPRLLSRFLEAMRQDVLWVRQSPAIRQ